MNCPNCYTEMNKRVGGGVMVHKVIGYFCPSCGYKTKPKTTTDDNRAYEAGYAYACGYHD